MVPQSALPAAIRAGSPEDQKAYRAALGFERELLRQLTEVMADAAKSASGDEETSGAAGAYEAMLPDTLADAITAQGGIGIAEQLYRGLRP